MRNLVAIVLVSGLVLMFLIVIGGMVFDALGGRMRSKDTTEELKQLNVTNDEMRDMLLDTRVVLRQIAETAVAEEDRILASAQALKIGEFLIDSRRRSD